jgi:hypothetical protein
MVRRNKHWGEKVMSVRKELGKLSDVIKAVLRKRRVRSLVKGEPGEILVRLFRSCHVLLSPPLNKGQTHHFVGQRYKALILISRAP